MQETRAAREEATPGLPTVAAVLSWGPCPRACHPPCSERRPLARARARSLGGRELSTRAPGHRRHCSLALAMRGQHSTQKGARPERQEQQQRHLAAQGGARRSRQCHVACLRQLHLACLRQRGSWTTPRQHGSAAPPLSGERCCRLLPLEGCTSKEGPPIQALLPTSGRRRWVGPAPHARKRHMAALREEAARGSLTCRSCLGCRRHVAAT